MTTRAAPPAHESVSADVLTRLRETFDLIAATLDAVREVLARPEEETMTRLHEAMSELDDRPRRVVGDVFAEIERLNATIQGQRDVADELREALGAIRVRFHERGAEIERLRRVATLTERLLDAIDADGEWLTMLHPIRAALRRETP
jgi:hypothetical protein